VIEVTYPAEVNFDDIGIATVTMTIVNDFGGELKKEIFRICGN
tara:strand:+ start:684 stop:812 length:129 start_codon:yes stop_codon:yes gene_type:complete